jgi:GNAT superfamily N-acetyltransferase
MSVLFRNRATETTISTGTTGVLRQYRRRGLATTLKLRAIRYALDNPAANGTIPAIRTGNEENNPMLDLNKQRGFVEESAYVSFARTFEKTALTERLPNWERGNPARHTSGQAVRAPKLARL